MEHLITPCIIQSFLILTSLVLIILIVLKYKDKWQKHNDCRNCEKEAVHARRKNSLHLKYIAGCLCFVIILLFTSIAIKEDPVRNPSPSFYEYFSFASVLVSIILAVLTIVYSYVMNGRSIGQAEKLEQSSTNINNISESIGEKANIIAHSANSLSRNITEILAKLDHIVGSTDKSSKLTEELLKSAMTTNNTKISTNQQEAENFIKQSPPFGVYTLLACKYSAQINRGFSSKDIFNDESEYMFGYLMATRAAGLVKGNYDVKTNTYTAVEINSWIRDNIEKSIEKRMSTITDQEQKKEDEETIQKIKDFFEIKNQD